MFRGLVVVLFLAVSLHAQEHRTFTVPFHTVDGMILLDGQINGKPATLLLDTGAMSPSWITASLASPLSNSTRSARLVRQGQKAVALRTKCPRFPLGCGRG